MKKIKIGLLGFGTIGQGVVKILAKNSKEIQDKSNCQIIVSKILVKNPGKERDIDPPCDIVTDIREVLDDPSIQAIVELIGGYEPARTYIIDALKKGKHVVTANKAVISKYWKTVSETAAENKAVLLYEAAVGGCIPIIRCMKEALACDRINSVCGIVNGTTNYILTKMRDEKMKFAEALQEAQDMGFAEADPSFDIQGTDSAHKLSIIALTAFNRYVDPARIHTEGIESVSYDDILDAETLGYTIKLLAIARQSLQKIDVRVHPTLVPFSHPLAFVKNEFNAMLISSENCTDQLLYGRGAGQLPTASAVVGNIIDLAQQNAVQEMSCVADAEIIALGSLSMRYCLRASGLKTPKALSQILEVLGRRGIGIEQASRQGDEGKRRILIITSSAVEKDLSKALEDIRSGHFAEEIGFIRIID